MVVTYEGLIAFVVMLCTVISTVLRLIEFAERWNSRRKRHDVYRAHERIRGRRRR